MADTNKISSKFFADPQKEDDWDKQIGNDIKNGRLNKFIKELSETDQGGKSQWQ